MASPRNKGRRSSVAASSSSSEDAELLQRIAFTLSSVAAFGKATSNVFNRYAVALHDGGAALPSSHISNIFKDFKLPANDVHIFFATLSREVQYQATETISLDTFQSVMTKVLRRIRDRHSGGFSRHQLVTQNKRTLEDEYRPLNSYAKGAFGACFWVEHKVTGAMRVVKRIAKERMEVPHEEVETELNLLKQMDHPNIVRLFEWFETEMSFLLVMEAARGGDLEKLLRDKRKDNETGLGENMVLHVVDQALMALCYIHSKAVVHRDIKPANIFSAQVQVGEDGADDPESKLHVLIADFGIAEVFGPDLGKSSVGSQKKGTWAYMAPEVFEDLVSPKTDVWALGVVAYELLCGMRPFGNDAFEVHFALCCDEFEVDRKPLEDAGVTKLTIDLIERLLEKEANTRPSAKAALEDVRKLSKSNLPKNEESRRQSLVKAITTYSGKSTFSKTALLCVASQLDTSKMTELNHMFRSLDKDASGSLSIQECVSLLGSIGMHGHAIEVFVDSLDLDRSNSIEYSEFIAGCLDARAELTDSGLFHAFNVFDTNHDGGVSLEELREILSVQNIGAILPDGKTLDEVITELDTSKDGYVSYEEFKKYLDQERGKVDLLGRAAHSLRQASYDGQMQVALGKVGDEESGEVTQRLKEVFRQVDKDGNGKIARIELECFFRAQGWSEEDVTFMFDSLDTNKDGVLDIDEFTEWLMRP